MSLHRLLLLALLAAPLPARPASTGSSQLAAFGEAPFPPLYREAVTAWVDAAAAYRRGQYHAAAGVLDGLWARHPRGAKAWKELQAETVPLHRVADFGTPPAYAALRMLDECVRFRLAAGDAKPRTTLQLTVVLVGESEGLAPSSREDLAAGQGQAVVHALDPAFQGEGAARVLGDTYWLFDEYLLAITRGELGLRRVVVRLDAFRVALDLLPDRVKLSRPETERIFAAVPAEVARATSWWHLVYPSHVPTAPGFAGVRFITGGMRAGPRGTGAPCFVSEDLKHLRAPNQDGRRVLTRLEREVALPQWLQHEFFHHLFGLFREEGLEARPHQWFRRVDWPPDFEGFGEADYFAEAIQKRLRRQGPRAFAARLARPAAAPAGDSGAD